MKYIIDKTECLHPEFMDEKLAYAYNEIVDTLNKNNFTLPQMKRLLHFCAEMIEDEISLNHKCFSKIGLNHKLK